jgi:hypothetical protein
LLGVRQRLHGVLEHILQLRGITHGQGAPCNPSQRSCSATAKVAHLSYCAADGRGGCEKRAPVSFSCALSLMVSSSASTASESSKLKPQIGLVWARAVRQVRQVTCVSPVIVHHPRVSAGECTLRKHCARAPTRNPHGSSGIPHVCCLEPAPAVSCAARSEMKAACGRGQQRSVDHTASPTSRACHTASAHVHHAPVHARLYLLRMLGAVSPCVQRWAARWHPPPALGEHRGGAGGC